MIQITDNAQEQQLLPLFRLGFRPFFLAGALFAVVSILLGDLYFPRKRGNET